MNYEYHKETPDHGIMGIAELNKLGAGGWDNYAVYGGVFYFKREVVAKPAIMDGNYPPPETRNKKKHK